MKYQFAESIQRGIIYLLITDPEFYAQIVHLIKEDYFEYPVHTRIFNITTTYYSKYGKLPTEDILLEQCKDNLKGSEDLTDYVDELYRINSLNKESIEHRDYILEQIEKFARQSAIKQALAESITLLKSNKLGEIETKIRSALTVSRNVDTGESFFDNFEARIDERVNATISEKYPILLPGITQALDGGLERKELAMVVAPAGVGKSVYLVNQAVHYLTMNLKVLYVSLEMSEKRIADRFDSIMTNIPQRDLKDKHNLLKERLSLFKKEYDDSNLIIKQFPTKKLTVNSLRAFLDQIRLHHDFTPDIIVVDYLELMNPTTEINQEYMAQERIAQELRGLAIELDIIIFTATQTNREGKRVKTITDLELGNSYDKIRPFDLAFSLNQTSEEFDKGAMRAYIMKARNGRSRFTIPLRMNYNTLTIEEIQLDGLAERAYSISSRKE